MIMDSVIVLCFVVRYFISMLVLQSLMGQRELVALLCLSSWCLMTVVCLMMPHVCLQFVIVVFHDHTNLLFLNDSVIYLQNNSQYVDKKFIGY